MTDAIGADADANQVVTALTVSANVATATDAAARHDAGADTAGAVAVL